MENRSKIVLIISLIFNALLATAVIALLLTQSNEGSRGESIAQNDALANIRSETPVLTQTPIVVTVIATPSPPPDEPVTTSEPTTTAVPTDTPVPATPTEPPPPTATPEPTASPTPEPTPTAAPTKSVYTGPDWLRYVNIFRAQSGLPFVIEDPELSEGSTNHSRYMVLNSSSLHTEDPNLPGYSESGNTAGVNGNIAISGVAGTNYQWATDFWMSAPFHAVPMLDPELTAVGYGDFSDPDSSFGTASTLDVRSGSQTGIPADYPFTFPGDGGQTWVRYYSLPEYPNATASCLGYQQPTGPPLVLILGDGSQTPNIQGTQLLQGGDTPLPHCVFDETSFTHPNEYQQQLGRTILDERDAVVILPREALQAGQDYTVVVNNGSDTITWTFSVLADSPQTTGAAGE